MFQLYSAIWRASGKRQIVLIVLSLLIAVLAAVPLNFQKDIINGLTDGGMDRAALVWMCVGMMATILISLALKWVMGYRANLLGEDIIRLLRRLVLRDAAEKVAHDTSYAGTSATMISAEAEELGKFTGSAFSEPVMQVGTLISVIGFIASTQPRLGLIAIAMILPQVFVVLLTQAKINGLISERVHILRRANRQMSSEDAVALEGEVHQAFYDIYAPRRSIFRWKLSTKFILSSLNGAGTVAVLLLGGSLVIEGRTDVGTIVAAVMGLQRLQAPTAFLIAFYREVSATRVKFELLRDAGIMDASGQTR